MKQEYFVKIQRKKTQMYEGKQHYQRTITLPASLCRMYDLDTGQYVRLSFNGNGEITFRKTESRPLQKRMTYEEWLRKIEPHIPTTGPGKIYTQICKEAGLTMRAAPAEWVHKAQIEIRLKKTRDKQTHHIVWTRIALPERKDQKPKETMLKEVTLREFQVQLNSSGPNNN